jgi:hypothetical protein
MSRLHGWHCDDAPRCPAAEPGQLHHEPPHQHIAPRAAGHGLGTAPRLADAPKWLPNDLAGLPPYLAPAPAGSSPKQRRPGQKAQAQNLARAGVQPTTVKIKNSSVATAPGATAEAGRWPGGGHA